MSDEDVLQPVSPVDTSEKKRRNYGGRPRGKLTVEQIHDLVAAGQLMNPDDWAILEHGKKEGVLKHQCLEIVKQHYPDFVIFQHQDHGTAGIPDWSVTGGGRTIWLEFKYADPALISRAIQELTCRKLENAGENCYYVVYFEARGQRETLICLPSRVYRGTWLTEYLGKAEGFDHNLVAAFLGVSR